MEATFRKSVAVEIAYLLLNSLGPMLNMSFQYAVMMNQNNNWSRNVKDCTGESGNKSSLYIK